jgi:uncharacterized membrane protein
MRRLKLTQRVGRAMRSAHTAVTRSMPAVVARGMPFIGWWARRARARLCPPRGVAAVLMIAITAPTAALAQAPGPPTDAEILALVRTHCVPCHAAEPTHEAFARAPAGIVLETIPQIAANAARIMTQVVVSRAMPLGNQAGMTDEERDRIAAWIEGRNK